MSVKEPNLATELSQVEIDMEFQEFKDTHAKCGVFIMCKETGNAGGYILPEMPIQDWIKADRIAQHKIKKIDAIAYRSMVRKERKERRIKKTYGNKKK